MDTIRRICGCARVGSIVAFAVLVSVVSEAQQVSIGARYTTVARDGASGWHELGGAGIDCSVQTKPPLSYVVAVDRLSSSAQYNLSESSSDRSTGVLAGVLFMPHGERRLAQYAQILAGAVRLQTVLREGVFETRISRTALALEPSAGIAVSIRGPLSARGGLGLRLLDPQRSLNLRSADWRAEVGANLRFGRP